MENIWYYIIIGAIVLGLIVFLIVKIIKFAKMSSDEKKTLLKTYLKGIIALAEQTITGNKKGTEKLQMVENYFKEKAPLVYKIILALLGKDSLSAIIEEALKEIKESFEK
jgi:hypothetical protein